MSSENIYQILVTMTSDTNFLSCWYHLSFSSGKCYCLWIIYYVPESHEGLWLSLISRISDSVGSGWGQGICISNQFRGDSDIAGDKCWRVQAFPRRQGLSKMGICPWKKCILNRVFISRESITNIHRYVVCADTSRGAAKELVPALKELIETILVLCEVWL